MIACTTTGGLAWQDLIDAGTNCRLTGRNRPAASRSVPRLGILRREGFADAAVRRAPIPWTGDAVAASLTARPIRTPRRVTTRFSSPRARMPCSCSPTPWTTAPTSMRRAGTPTRSMSARVPDAAVPAPPRRARRPGLATARRQVNGETRGRRCARRRARTGPAWDRLTGQSPSHAPATHEPAHACGRYNRSAAAGRDRAHGGTSSRPGFYRSAAAARHRRRPRRSRAQTTICRLTPSAMSSSAAPPGVAA